MYIGSSVKTAQLLAISSVLVQALLTDSLTCRFTAHLCFPREPWWLQSCCHAKCCTVQVVWTFPLHWDDQHEHTDTKSTLTIHYRTLILYTLRHVNVFFLRINRPSLLFPSLCMLSKTDNHDGRTYQFVCQPQLTDTDLSLTHVLPKLHIRQLFILCRKYHNTSPAVPVPLVLRYFLFRIFTCGNKGTACCWFSIWRFKSSLSLRAVHF